MQIEELAIVLNLTTASVVSGHAQHEPGIAKAITSKFRVRAQWRAPE